MEESDEMDRERENPVMPIPRDGDGRELRGEKRREYGEEKVSIVGERERVRQTE